MDKTQLQNYLANTNALNEESEEVLKQLTVTFPWFQAGWLLYAKNLKNTGSANFNNTLKKVAVLVPDRKNLYKFLNSNGQSKHSQPLKTNTASVLYKLEEDQDNNNENSLIDKFLSSEPTVRKKRNLPETNTTPVENSGILEKSVTENDEIITETLANIYAQQKNYDKALNAYKKLSLKYPEKSVYFASRIKEIEVLKNNI